VPAYRAASFIATSPSSVNTIFAAPPAGTIDPASGAAGGVTVVDGDGRATRYSLLQFHFHRPAEEVLPGAPHGHRRLIGIHLVHEVADPGDGGGGGGGGFGRPRGDDAGRLLVVAASLEAGDAAHPALAAALAALGPDGKPATVAARTPPIDPRAFLPASVDGGCPLFWFQGGLTTPPCSPGVDWVVCGAATGTATRAQAAGLGREDNARPLQGRGGRRVYVSGGGGGST
jgi:carbonic anhydrase